MSAGVLDRCRRTRRDFDPSRREDLAELNYFLAHSKWRSGCPFTLEDGFAEIPYQCLVKFAKHRLKRLTVE